jgi:hypothetical protein
MEGTIPPGYPWCTADALPQREDRRAARTDHCHDRGQEGGQGPKPRVYNLGSSRSAGSILPAEFHHEGDLGSCYHKGDNGDDMERSRRAIRIPVRSKVTNLRFALTNTKKGNMTMSQYFTKMKGLADELAASGKTLDDEEIVSYILNSLDSDHTPFVSSIMSQLEPITVNELYAQALGFESQQAMLHETDQQFMSTANSAMR